MEKVNLYKGDCLEVMKTIPDGSVDMILCDLPYGTTACKWDTVIPFDPLWIQYNRIIKKNGAIVLFGSEPFSSHLRLSNLSCYKNDWIWKKSIPKGHLNSKKYPMRIYENISVFCKNTPVYNPQMFQSKPMNSYYKSGGNGKDSIYGKMQTVEAKTLNRTERFPQDIIQFSELPNNSKKRFHPTQKPVALLEYLIRTYTNIGQTVLDNCMGSGSTGVACINTDRKFIGIEKDDKYFEIAKNRINDFLNKKEY